jgi:putative transposase
MEKLSSLIEKICILENIQRNQIIIHADNGNPQEGLYMLVTLKRLGIVPSFSRPGVSNDNAY